MDFADMTPEQIAELIEQGKNELIRHQNNTLLDERLAEVQAEFREAGILHAPPEEWERPAEVRDTYGRGDVVEWEDGHREAIAGFVVCSPACNEHWIDYMEPAPDDDPDETEDDHPEPTPWSTEAGTLRIDQIVAHEGQTYRVKKSHAAKTEWAPDVMPGLFEEVADA